MLAVCSPQSSRFDRARGFTLVELMIGLVVAGLLLAMAIPNMQRMGRQQELRSATSQLETAFRKARAIAIKTRSDVRVSVSAGSHTCTVEQDTDGDGIYERMIQQNRIKDIIDIASVSLGGGNQVSFDDRGRPDSPGTIQLFESSGRGRQILVSAGSGSVSVSSLSATPSP